MSQTNRIKFSPVQGADKLFTSAFLEYLEAAHERFTPRVHELRVKRAELLDKALNHGVMPGHPNRSPINTGDWQVPCVPQDLMTAGIEISGPASITGMFINALNPGPDGSRAEGDLDDDEDSGGHRLVDTVSAALNRLGAVERTLVLDDRKRGRKYEIREGNDPLFHAPRAWVTSGRARGDD